MTHDLLVNTYVFLFFFAFGYLLAGKRPLLSLSTRIVMVVLFGLGLAFAVSGPGLWHDVISGATLIANAVFLGFGVLDYVAFTKRESPPG